MSKERPYKVLYSMCALQQSLVTTARLKNEDGFQIKLLSYNSWRTLSVGQFNRTIGNPSLTEQKQ